MQKALIHAALILLLSAPVGWATAQPPVSKESSTVAQARELVDTYYGKQVNLLQATQLLEQAYKEDPRDANVFVQAARITVMGGHIKFENFEPGTFARYGALLDRALTLDPANPKAHILKAQVFERKGDFKNQLSELERARGLGTSDPWLQIGLGRYFMNVGVFPQAYAQFRAVELRGPGETASERKAFVAAMFELFKLEMYGENRAAKLREYAEAASAARHPDDAWTPHGLAEYFIDVEQFDVAVGYAREALQTMNFGAGRLTLAAALYAQAAQMKIDGHTSSELLPVIEEAMSFGFSRSVIIEYLVEQRGGGHLKRLETTLKSFLY